MSEIETSLIGFSRGDASRDTFYASNPATGEQLSVAYASASNSEVDRAADLGARLVGVNARNLSTFELDKDLFGRLAPRLPEDAVKIAESAVLSPADVAHYRSAGADVVLVGEALVTGDPVATLASFLDAAPDRRTIERSRA